MCTTDLCNANDYNLHTERANRLFGKPPQQSEAVRSPFFPPTGSASSSSRDSQVTIVTPSSNLVEEDSNEEVDAVKVHDRDQERTETLWTDKFDDLLVEESVDDFTEAPRLPRQTQGNANGNIGKKVKSFQGVLLNVKLNVIFSKTHILANSWEC